MSLNPIAAFSPCRRYRYLLTRSWLTGSGICAFVMLNPSTADETKNDPTVAKCMRYAANWGYQKLHVVNLFGWRATDPSELPKVADPIGPENDRHILATLLEAWGNDGAYMSRGNSVRMYGAAIRGHVRGDLLSYLQLNKTGEPQHPLYLRGDFKPQSWLGAAVVPS